MSWRRASCVIGSLVFLFVACSDDSNGGGSKKVGETCSAATECAEGICHDGLCLSSKPLANDQACTNKAECKSLKCENGKCQAGTKLPGEKCLNSEECATICVAGECVAAVNDAGIDSSKTDGTTVKPDGITSSDGVTAKKVEEYIPGDNEVSGWVENPDQGAPGVEKGYTTLEIEAIIDGEHDPYRDAGCNGFAKQDYKKTGTDFTLALYVWDMKDTAAAQAMFTADKAKDEKDNGFTFETLAGVKDAAIIADPGAKFKVWVQKGHYIAKIQSYYFDAAKKDQLKPDVLAFVNLLVGKLP